MNNKWVIIILLIILSIFTYWKYDEHRQVRELTKKNSVTIVLNDDFEGKDIEKILKNYEDVFNTQVKEERFPNIKFDVKVMSNEQAIKYIDENEDTLGIIDSADYLATEFLDSSSNTRIMGLIKTFGYDESFDILPNILEETRPVRAEYNPSKHQEFTSLSIKEIAASKNKSKLRVGVSKGKYDATKVWLYNYLIDNGVELEKIKVTEYQNEEEGRNLLTNDKIDILITDYLPYFNNKDKFKEVYSTKTGLEVQPLSQFIVVNDQSSKQQEKYFIEIFNSIYQNSQKIKKLNSAYGAVDVANIGSLKSLEEQRTLRKFVKNYIYFIENKEEDNE